MSTSSDDYRGCAIPPDVYEIGFGWDTGPEVERLLFLACEHGAQPSSALELGCGAGRLLAALGERVSRASGIELSEAMAQRARSRSAASVMAGDMSEFALDASFDLIYASANTIRHVIGAGPISSMWRCIADHLNEGVVFIADLDLGLAAERERVGKPAFWTISRGAESVRVGWAVTRPPGDADKICEIEFSFEARGDALNGTWRERFRLRSYDAREFVELAENCSGLQLGGLYEIRDPHLPRVEVDRAVGRHMVVFEKRA